VNAADPRRGDEGSAERLARIEAQLADLRAVLGGVPAPGPPRDVGRALGRLGVAVWLAGLLALASGSWIAGVEAARDPRANVCVAKNAADYPECLRKPATGSGTSFLESLQRLVVGPDVDRERVVHRAETARYATSLRRLAGVAVGWTIAVLGAVAVLTWVARGLRPRRSH
jgi:hypothetical protein